MSGKNNPAYIDGNSKERRCWRGSNWERIRRKVYERDDNVCQICGTRCISKNEYDGTNGSKIRQCHHKEKYEENHNNNLDNLITICASCHGKNS